MITPWTIHEAEVALYPAWKDGMPFRGPGLPRAVPAAVFACKSALTISATPRKTAVTGHSWTGAEAMADGEWEISLAFPDGAFSDAVSRMLSRLASGGFHILVARFIDQASGQWSCFRWFYTTWEGDEASESGQILGRTMRLRSTWMQEEVGATGIPSLAPTVLGEVDWICGSQRITCLTYHPETETWSSTPRNDAGDGSRYVNLSPLADTPTDIALSAYFPRVVAGSQVPPALSRAAVSWQNLVLLRLGNHLSSLHHGLVTLGGITIQAAGISEPLLARPQDRMLDEPVIVFRYLRRIYATLGHGVLAVPALRENTAPPFSHDYPFRLAIPGAANPATGQSGLTLLPDGALLDGTVTEIQ